MALNPKYATAAVNAKVNAQGDLLNSGFLDLYDGVQPASADTAITTQMRLARLTFGNPAFASGVSGVATANAITPERATHTGIATWFRTVQSDGTTAVYDGSVGTSGANLNLNSVNISVSASVSVTSFTMAESQG